MWSIFWFKRTSRANKWIQELEEGYNGKEDLCFPKYVAKTCMLYCNNTNLAGVEKAKIVPSFWEPLRYRISGQQNYRKEWEFKPALLHSLR
jgi:hypothetical protein